MHRMNIHINHNSLVVLAAVNTSNRYFTKTMKQSEKNIP